MAPVRVAIIGGSIAGTTLARGLANHDNISYDVFDGKTSFRERGAGVAIAPNAQKALRAMGIDAEGLLKEAGAMKMKSTYCIIGLGEHKGEKILDLPGGVYVVDRRHLLGTLLKGLDEERLHANKKLASIEQPGSTEDRKYTLCFEDGSRSGGFDAVIGCDGARSKIRELVLGPENRDKWAPRFGGYWDARGRITPQEAADKFGKELFDVNNVTAEFALIGNGAFILFAPSDDASVYHIVISAAAGPNFDGTQWKTQLSRSFLEDNYQDWDENFRTGVIDALMAEETGPGVVFSQWESPEATSYYREPGLAMMGDAAHSTVPFMGQGACMSMEDAAILSAVLTSVERPSEVTAALKAFDQTRRGRPEHVVRQSQEAAWLLTGQRTMNPADVKHLEAEKWWTDIWSIDMDDHVKQAKDCFDRIRSM